MVFIRWSQIFTRQKLQKLSATPKKQTKNADFSDGNIWIHWRNKNVTGMVSECFLEGLFQNYF